MRDKEIFQTIPEFFGCTCKSDTAVLFIFPSLSLLPSAFAFLASLFFFCRAFSKLHYGGKRFGKAFWILGLDERNGRWAVEQDFHGNF